VYFWHTVKTFSSPELAIEIFNHHQSDGPSPEAISGHTRDKLSNSYNNHEIASVAMTDKNFHPKLQIVKLTAHLAAQKRLDGTIFT
jgi:hypothetical protein